MYGRAGKVGEVTPEMLGGLAQRSMPMCMRQLHHHMTKHHHLRYHGRVQFRLFLKGIGISMEQCMAFFQKEFCKCSSATAGCTTPRHASCLALDPPPPFTCRAEPRCAA